MGQEENMKINWKLAAIVAFAIILFPMTALANAGTALMWTALIHLCAGNALIGYLEGHLLSKWFQTHRYLSIVILILANYVSAWVGVVWAIGRLARIPKITIENAYLWLCIFAALSFIVTVFVEYPFFWFLLRKQQQSFRKALKATLMIHGISYILLLSWYKLNSPTSLLTELDVVSVDRLQPQEEYVLYFITPDGTQVVRSSLDGKRQDTIKTLKATDEDNKLCIREQNKNTFDLVARSQNYRVKMKDGLEVVLSDFVSRIPNYKRPEHFSNFEQDRKVDCIEYYHETVPKLTENTNWEYRTSVWAAVGIMGHNKTENRHFHFALETPLVSWNARNATHLSGDFVVLQLGDDHIYILQPQEKKIALIVQGRSPIVVEANSIKKP
jgi:hypothetical protein